MECKSGFLLTTMHTCLEGTLIDGCQLYYHHDPSICFKCDDI